MAREPIESQPDVSTSSRALAACSTSCRHNLDCAEDRTDAARQASSSPAALFVAVVVAIAVYGQMAIRRALGNPQVTAVEVGLAGVASGASHA